MVPVGSIPTNNYKKKKHQNIVNKIKKRPFHSPSEWRPSPSLREKSKKENNETLIMFR